MSLLFCTISMVSGYSFTINGITYEVQSNGLDLREAKTEILIAKVIDISNDLLNNQNTDGILAIPFLINYGKLEYIVTLSVSAVKKAEKFGVSIILTPVD